MTSAAPASASIAAPLGSVPASPDARADGYGRARLWLGVTGVGTMVVFAALALVTGLPDRWYDHAPADSVVGVFLVWLLVYAVLQSPFDWLGGWVLPRHYGRPTPPTLVYARRWARGVAVHAATLLAVAIALTLAGRVGGVLGTLGAAVELSFLMIGLRPFLAGWVARLRARPLLPVYGGLAERTVASDDESFTGGVHGLLRAEVSVAPAHWAEALGEDDLKVARRRRRIAVKQGLWSRGRWVAMGFTWVGVLLAAAIVGPGDLGTAGGTVELGLWFTLWSFLGLLTLPTLSRRAVAAIDRQLAAEGVPPERVAAVAETLNALQDGERSRPGAVEAIFHPIPAVANRSAVPVADAPPWAAWDAARTAVFLSAVSLGLLGRAVHCNAGKPALWVFLPTD